MAAEGALLEAKLAELGLEQSPEEFVAGLQPHIKRRVEHLQGLQKQRDDIEGTYRKELAELTTKYEKLYGKQPHNAPGPLDLGSGCDKGAGSRMAACVRGMQGSTHTQDAGLPWWPTCCWQWPRPGRACLHGCATFRTSGF